MELSILSQRQQIIISNSIYSSNASFKINYMCILSRKRQVVQVLVILILINFNQMIPLRDQENLNPDSTRPESLSNANNSNPSSFWEIYEDALTKRSRAIAVFIIICLIFGVIFSVVLVQHYLALTEIREQDLIQSYKLQNMKLDIGSNLEKYENTLTNLSSNLQKIRRQMLRMEVDLYKNLNQNQNHFAITRREKSTIDEKIKDFQEIFQVSRRKYVQQINTALHRLKSVPPIPKILWFYTEFNFESQKMITQMFGNFIIDRARNQGFEIRFVNSWSAYEFLSNETSAKITKAMQNNKLEQRVGDLLRLGLLMDNGGMMIKVDQSLLIGDFKWVHKFIKFDQKQEPKLNNQVFLFREYTESETLVHDYFIAAIKNSRLINQTFDIFCETLMTGKFKFKALKEEAFTSEEVGSTIVPNMTRLIIQSLFDVMTPQYYSVLTFDKNVNQLLSTECRTNVARLLKRPYGEYLAKCGQPYYILHIDPEGYRGKVEEEMEYEVTNTILGADRNSYWHVMMQIGSNRRLFDPLPARPIHFCLIDAHPSNDYQLIINSFEKLKQQKFKQYTAVYFVNSETQQNKKYAKQQSDQGFRLILPVHTGSLGRNYQVGIIKNCPNKSFVMVLRRNESLNDVESLQVLSEAMGPRNVLGAFVGLNISGQVQHSKDVYPNYNKVEYNSKEPKLKDLSTILNHLRVFHSDCYKIIPQFDLRTPEGKYFNDRFTFLEQFLQMVREMRDKHDYTEIPHQQKVSWYMKSNADIFDVPTRIVASHNVLITTLAYQEVDKEELKQTFFRMDSFAMTYNLDHLVQNGIPMREFAVFNPANEYEPYTVRNKPQLIPKVFHLIWIEGEMPESKKKVLEMNKEIYPDFQFKVWSKDNITKQRFPLSFDLLHNIYNMENGSRFSKRATMADVFRHELMYNEGGIYMDTSMILFNRGIQKFLSYKLALSTERTFRHRWAQSMCIFAVMPKFPGLLRIISHNNTNRYNLWLRDALEIAGPHNFRWMVRGMQEYDPDYLIMNYDAFYPMTYSLTNYFETYCFIQPSFLSSEDKVVYKYKDRNMISGCGKYYPHAFGKELNSIGSSWQNPKW